MIDANEDIFEEDEIYGSRLLISRNADFWELQDNIRAARAILVSYPDTYIRINGHKMEVFEKNPEYTIDDLVGDRKGIMTENGIKSAFRKSLVQKCTVVVLDLDMHLSDYALKTIKLSMGLYGRHDDFTSGRIERCYIIYHGRSVMITRDQFSSGDAFRTKRVLQGLLQKLRV